MTTDGAVLRRLTTADLPAAFELSCEAGWNQAEEDWRTLITLAPDTCLGIQIDGRLVSTATLICYGKQLAWIGMVLTSAPYRGRGYAKRLLRETLRIADELRIETVKLDATDQGEPLYQALGFRGEQVVERWEGTGRTPATMARVSSSLSDELTGADKSAFGADRSRLLENLGKHRVLSCERAFLLTRPGRTHTYLGPCVSESAEDARELIHSAVASAPYQHFYWDILASNASATSLAREFGFVPRRRLLRMVRGRELRADENRVYGLAGFEFG